MEKKCQFRGCWAAQSVPEYKCCPFIQARHQQQDRAGSGITALPCSWPGRKPGTGGSCGQGQCEILGPGTQLPTQLGSDCTRDYSKKGLLWNSWESLQDLLVLAAFRNIHALSCQPWEDVQMNFTRWRKLGAFVQDHKFGGKVHHLYPSQKKK